MPIVKATKSSFTSGAISPRLLGRVELKAYINGAATLQNVFVESTGGLYRRPGLRYIDLVAGDGRLVAFEFNTQQTYSTSPMERKILLHMGFQFLSPQTSKYSLAVIRKVTLPISQFLAQEPVLEVLLPLCCHRLRGRQ